MKSTASNIRLLSARVAFSPQPFARPLQLSGGTITEITQADAVVQIACGDQEAVGRGSIYLSDLWAWPDAALTHEFRDAHMQQYSVRLAQALPDILQTPAHPLELGMQLHEAVYQDNTTPVPLMARLVCASSFDAAIHDAAGQALGCSAFSLYADDVPVPSADGLFPGSSATEAIRAMLQPPAAAATGWYVVSGTDPLTDDFHRFIQSGGFHAFKLKTHGKDPEADAARTVEVYRKALAAGVSAPRLSADSNEGNPDADSVLDFLKSVQRRDAEAFAALEYLEQPTGRDLTKHAWDWREVASLKPVYADEGLTGPQVLPLLLQQGWSGICLKTCKGHSFNLVAGAWAHARGLHLTVQDLTNPGAGALHSCLMALHTPSRNGVELNSPQFTPAANADWQEREPGLFLPTDGRHRVLNPHTAGLGASPPREDQDGADRLRVPDFHENAMRSRPEKNLALEQKIPAHFPGNHA